MTITAAGILIQAKSTGNFLFLLRGDGSDYPNDWAFPGGRQEKDETLADCAMRECMEESGFQPDHLGHPLVRTITRSSADDADVSFTTYTHVVEEEFTPQLNDEHKAYCWAPKTNPPQPLHPGASIALQRLDMDELGIAEAMRFGKIASPQRYENIALFKMRVTGTGVSYRKALDEFVWRDPAVYLNDEFLRRCNGLPVIWEHPQRAMLNSEEFADRIVGTVFLPFLQDDEVWCIAKVYDAEAIRLMETEQLSTSPSVVFRNPDVNSKMELDDGSVLLVEGKPSLLDHLAICERGVWDKGGEPTGIVMAIGDSQMAEENKETEVQSDADAGAKLDKVLAHLDSVASMCDALSKRMDSFEEMKKDNEEEEEEKKDEETLSEKEEPVEVAADKRKDEDEETQEKEREVAKADSEKFSKLESENAELRKMIEGIQAKLPRSRSDAEHDQLISAQARADSVFQAFGKRAPRPLDGETLLGYRRRLSNALKTHSPTWKDVDLNAIHDDSMLGIAEKQIYSDAQAAALHPVDLEEGQLREIIKVDPTTGQRMSTFVGKHTFIHSMKRQPRAVVGIGLPRGH